MSKRKTSTNKQPVLPSPVIPTEARISGDSETFSSKRLLELYDRVADAPDAVERLRKFVLDLAVRGKLVEQDPEDEPETALLKLFAAGKVERTESPSKNWMCANLGNVLNFQYGKGMKKSERLEQGPVPVFGSNGVIGFTTEPLTDRPAIIVGRKGSAGALNLCNGPSWTTDVAYFVEPPQFFDLHYLLLSLKSLNLDTLGKGVKPGLSRTDAYELSVHIPPLAEQHRILAKVEELMALLDRLETTRTKRETTRDRLTTASLTRLTAPETTEKEFPAHARFALDNLHELTTRPDEIRNFRQTILNLAVRGQLVEQNMRDECASKLLEKLSKCRSTECRRKEKFAPVTKHEQQFSTPPGWRWARFGDIFSIRTGFAFKSSSYTDTGILVFRVVNFNRNGSFDLSDAKFFPEYLVDERMTPYLLESGEILMVMVGGSIGKTTKVTEDILPALLNQNMWRIRSYGKLLSNDYEFLLVRTINQEIERITASTHGHFAISDFEQKPVCIPPLAEQYRIVARTDEVMAFCDQLEAALTTANTTRARLLETLLHDSLARDSHN